MKNILTILFSLTVYNISFAQKTLDNISKLSGTWLGKAGDNPIKFQVVQNGKNSFTFSIINFQNQKFIIKKSDVITNEKNEIVIHIKEAKFSSLRFENCVFSTGTITIVNSDENHKVLNLKSVGPTCWIMDDVSVDTGDLNDILLTKEKSSKVK
ncbi:hypothetical protein [Chryseobacterium pennipullorum]|uniref:Uncharacterized protein n=1 Tax=Chryseobacterium pennipullorum TaxID=2258963 RepID=A0A3D9B3J1_9FLAO|nr:hypothetical protein [Chryseobacterium pennipullorum]REC48201.1 hypothetical protein DRF67_07630 [Chryseobacterium pennipullorum]